MASHSPNPTTVKFLCSYGGRILPRYPDGKLRYHGGEIRVLSVPRSVSFTELARKLSEICGMAVSLRCQLPADDLDALVTVTSDEDLANLIEEYDCASTAAPLKIRAFLSPLKSTRTTTTSSPPPSTTSPSSKSSSRSPPSPTSPCPMCLERSIRNNGCYAHRNPNQNHFYLIHN